MKTIKKTITFPAASYIVPCIKELIDRSFNGEKVVVQLSRKDDESFKICVDYEMIHENNSGITAAITFEDITLFTECLVYESDLIINDKNEKFDWEGIITNIRKNDKSDYEIEIEIPLPWKEQENKCEAPKKAVKLKEYTAKFRITPKREPDLEYLMESYEEGKTDLIDLFVEDEETGEVIVSYDALDYKINDRFYDVDFCRGYEKFQDKLVSEGKLCYICQPQITGMREEGNFLMVDLAIPMPWAEDTNISGVPAVPEKEQVYSLLEGAMNVVCKRLRDSTYEP